MIKARLRKHDIPIAVLVWDDEEGEGRVVWDKHAVKQAERIVMLDGMVDWRAALIAEYNAWLEDETKGMPEANREKARKA